MSEAIIAKKAALVEEVTEKFKAAASVVIVDYRGLTVDEVTRLRKQLRDANVEMKVIKNSILSRAAQAAGLEGLDEEIKLNDTKLEELDVKQKQVFEQISKNELPASSVITALKELYLDIENCNNTFNTMKNKLDSAKSDEERANKQLLKLQLIMNEMQVKLRKHRLPSISSSYEADLIHGYEYIANIDLQSKTILIFLSPFLFP